MAYSTAYAILRNKEEAQDAVQEAFIKAYNSLNSFQGRSKFSTWLFRIVYYTSLTKYQNTKYQRISVQFEDKDQFDRSSAVNDGLISLHDNDRIKFLHAAMNQLNPEDKLAITLYYVEEKSQPEIAGLTGWNLSATKVRIHRARQKLDRYLSHALLDDKKSLL
jgi:RNA polymerase sigma factor (sigma-70 family)